jgi:two-component system sensor histidine kinase VicK
VSNTKSLFINLNQNKFSRVLNNLLGNAIKFSHRKQQILVSADVQTERGTIIIKVQDSGIGIPEDLKSMIFDKFTKAGRKGTEGEKSLGLGMSIVKRIVELHNGRIWMESKENIGTTIFIELNLPKDAITQNVNA